MKECPKEKSHDEPIGEGKLAKNGAISSERNTDENQLANKAHMSAVALFLCGDVMTGRGIDQILPHPSRPHLYEICVRDANDYVRLAERQNGPLPIRPLGFTYPWGDALEVLEEMRPDVRIINLETSVTTSEDNWPEKGIHYRMHPDNIATIRDARIDCCVLANNHVLDWGHRGLRETLAILHDGGIRTAGAGRDETEAATPAIIELDDGGGGSGGRRRVLVYGCADESSGVPRDWAATDTRGGVNLIDEKEGIGAKSADKICRQIEKERRPDDIVVVSIHWGGNWGYQIPREQRQFAHHLIDSGIVDIVHGHSSHHAKGLEIYRGKLILYGCGDFLNDYEGIKGQDQDEYHDECTLMYMPVVDPEEGGKLVKMQAVPMMIKNMRLNRATDEAASWLHATMKRECAKFGVKVDRNPTTNTLTFFW